MALVGFRELFYTSSLGTEKSLCALFPLNGDYSQSPINTEGILPLISVISWSSCLSFVLHYH